MLEKNKGEFKCGARLEWHICFRDYWPELLPPATLPTTSWCQRINVLHVTWANVAFVTFKGTPIIPARRSRQGQPQIASPGYCATCPCHPFLLILARERRQRGHKKRIKGLGIWKDRALGKLRRVIESAHLLAMRSIRCSNDPKAMSDPTYNSTPSG